MANWCYNTVIFEATVKTLNKLQTLFEDLAAKQLHDGYGQLPDFIAEKNGYFFFIRWEENVLYYETKWSPNTEIVVAIANQFKCAFIQEYHESMMQIFGKCTYKNKILETIELGEDDYALIELDEENIEWVFEGDRYDNENEILEILLERKMINQQ